ncbi:uncharacterized protein LOC127446691 [Myxocyprinus asiaticus]|uniref:uncharacterized protein LOC127446691 n=1 Tax=Myxocyprinus asiaticus TaxID=70543 RepID=UPI0022223377|nr:uncharacterized protein LOC127446691 [Myxocyprinus asiaticus]
MSESKSPQQWSTNETRVLLTIWSSTEIQEKLKRSKRRKRVYDEISQEMLNAGFIRSNEQIVNKLKKLRKDYRDKKTKINKKRRKKDSNYDVILESVLAQQSATEVTEALNSATVAALETNAESPVFSANDLGSKTSENKTVQQWSLEETSVLLGIWSSSDIQEKLETLTRKKKVYDEICQEMANAGFSRTTEQVINKLKKLKKEFRDQKKDLRKCVNERIDKTVNYNSMEVMERLQASELTGAFNSATAMLETKVKSLMPPVSNFDSLVEIDEVLEQAESSFSTSQSQPRRCPQRIRIRKKDSNKELLEFLQTSDERFMEHARELNAAILKKMDEATNSMLGLLGRMVAVMEGQEANKQ